jgi:UDP:flavonoid glycosyltransferase YjiC (YdhE family)
VPLFADQPHNARRVAAVGAGLVASPDPGAIRDAVGRVLKGESYPTAAESLAAELRRQRSIDAAVDVLAGLTRVSDNR